MKINYKVISIVLLIYSILLTILIVSAFKMGADSMDKEYTCALDICEDKKYTAYYYDDIEQICYCMIGDEIEDTKYMG